MSWLYNFWIKVLRELIRVIIELFCSRKFDWFVLYLTIYVIVFSFEALTNATYIGTSVTEFSTWVSVKLKLLENSALSAIDKYCFSRNFFSNCISCCVVKGVRGFRFGLCFRKVQRSGPRAWGLGVGPAK